MADFTLRDGDKVTFAGIYQRNPRWRWWRPWVAKTLPALQTFTIIGDPRG